MDPPVSSPPILLVKRKPINTRKREEYVEDISDEPSKVIRTSQVEPDSTSNEDADKLDLHYEANVTNNLKYGTTSSAEYEADEANDHRMKRELAASQHTDTLSGKYLGQASYYQFITRHDTARASALSDKNFKAGPMRIAANIRNTCRFDYAPDLCKDYNETGFCGFGDSCKFLHDRGDYKSGWEIEEEWQEKQKREKEGKKTDFDYTIKQEDVDIPTKTTEDYCSICKGSFVKPIVETKCGHKFCEKCALAESRKSTKCAFCGEETNGLFKVVKKK